VDHLHNMRIFITTIFSLLLLATFAAPVAIDTNSIDLNIAFAQGTTEVETGGAIPDNGTRFLGEKELTGFLQAIAALFLQMGAALLWMAGALFNFGIKYSILEFASFANISGIPIAWTVLRDITNVFFIFIFLAIGIGTILNLQQYGVKKLLPVLLAVAVLINFSLFFTKVTIDVAHGFAGAILNQSGVVVTECDQGNCDITQGVATAFIEQLGVVNIFGASVDTTLGPHERDRPIFTGDRLSDGFSALLFGLFGFIFLSAAAIVFLAGAVLLIMRIVKLLLLMIASAPALAAYVLPSTRKHFNTWLETLLKEAFFAPVLLLLFAISLLFLNTARGTFVSGDQSFAEIFVNGNLDSVNIIVIFLIALGLLFMSIKVAGDMGVSGAKMAMGVQNWGTKRMSAAASGGVAFAGRNTIGRGSAAIAGGLRNTKFGRTSLGKLATTQVFDKVGDMSFDGRALADKNLQKAVGKPVKGFTSQVKDRAKSDAAYAKDLGLNIQERGAKTKLENNAEEKKEALKASLTSASPEAVKAAEDERSAAANNLEALKKEYETKLKYATASEAPVFEAERDVKVADANTELSDAETKLAALKSIDSKSIDKEVKKIDEQLKKDKKEVDARPKQEFADNLKKEVRGKVKQMELTTEGIDIEDRLEDLSKQIEDKGNQVKDASTETVRTALEGELKVLKAQLQGAQADKLVLQSSNKYQARTGDYKAGALGFMGTDASGKFAGAAAIEKELKKGDDKKNIDAIIKGLKDDSGGDKKKDEDE